MTGALPRDLPEEMEQDDASKKISSAAIVPIRERGTTVPLSLAQIIDKALENDIEKRYPSAIEMLAALAELGIILREDFQTHRDI